MSFLAAYVRRQISDHPSRSATLIWLFLFFLGGFVASETLAQDYTQVGADIVGAADGDIAGLSVSLSADGKTLAVGSPNNDGAANNAGHVRVFKLENDDWTQMGGDIEGSAEADAFGSVVSLSADGLVVAAGAHFNDANGNDAGSARVFAWNGTNWVQRGGAIVGTRQGDLMGSSVSLSDDGATLAVGGTGHDIFENDVLTIGNVGFVQIFTWNGTSWVQKGDDIDGVMNSENSGSTVSLSADGNVVAIGSPNGQGSIRVFAWEGGQWTQRGSRIEGTGVFDEFGSSLSLSGDGSVVAGGAPMNDDNGTNSGQVRVFSWTGTEWIQRGETMMGSETPDGFLAGDQFGASVSLTADGGTLAVGAPVNEISGQVFIKTWNGTAWVDQGNSIAGTPFKFENSGASVSISSDGLRVAIGSPTHENGLGRARSFAFTGEIESNSPPTFVAAGPFTVVEGKEFGDVIGDVDANDGDGFNEDQNVTYSIIGGNSIEGSDVTSVFAIDPDTGVITVNQPDGVDHAKAAQFTLVVQADDGQLDNNTATAEVVVTVSDVAPSQPEDIDSQDDLVAENLPAGAEVGITVVSSDPGGSPVTFSLTNDANGFFEIDASTGVVTTSTVLNFEDSATHEITVIAEDANGTLSASRSFIVSVANVNDPPVVTIMPGERSTAEGSPITLSAADNNSFTISDEDASFLGITLTADNGATITMPEGFQNLDGSGTSTVNFGSVVPDDKILAATFDGLTITPVPGIGENITLTITVLDPGEPGSTDGIDPISESLVISMIDINDAPVITSAAAVDAAENQTAVQTVTFTDPDAGDDHTFSITGGADAALFSVDAATGVLTFQAAPDFENPSDSDTDNDYEVEITVTDDGAVALTGSQTITVTVTDANDAPVITSAASANVNEGDTAVLTVTASDQDAGDNLAFSISGGADAALFSIDPSTGALAFQAAPDFEAPADADTDNDHEVEVTATDDGTGALTGSQLVTVTVVNVNDAPVVTAPAAETTLEESPVTFSAANTNAITVDDVDSANLNVDLTATSTVELGALGGITINGGANGTNAVSFTGSPASVNAALDGLIYTPSPNQTTGASLTIDVSDGALAASHTVTINITAVNDAPVAQNDAATTEEDTPVAIDVLANDLDPDGDALVISIDAAPSSGTVILEEDGTITYTPEAGFFGLDAFTYTISDGDLTAEASVSITVLSTNQAPMATADTGSVFEGESVTVNVLANDSDPDGDVLTLSITSAPDAGTVEASGGEITYTAPLPFEGSVEIGYEITDPEGLSADAVLRIAVSGAGIDGDGIPDAVENSAPNGGDGNGDGVLDGEQLHVSSFPAVNDQGQETFVTLEVPPDQQLERVSSSPNPSPDDFPEAATAPVGFLDFRITGVAPGGSSEMILFLPEGTSTTSYLKFGPTPDNPTPHWYDFGFDGTTGARVVGNRMVLSFVDGQRGDSDLSENGVIVDPGVPVAGLNQSPSAQPDTVILDEDSQVVVHVLNNDTDPDGDVLSVETVLPPNNGLAEVLADGSIRYIPDSDFFGSDQITYRISDPSGASDQATLSLTVLGIQDSPVARNDTAFTSQEIPVLIDVFANDFDPDGDNLSIASLESTSNGSVLYRADGLIRYTPANGFHGEDTWTYAITDGPANSGEIAAATVTVFVENQNDGPVAVADTVTTREDEPLLINVLNNDIDLDADTLSIAALTQPLTGGVVEKVTQNGSLDQVRFLPDADFNGMTQFEYVVTDNILESAPVAVVITVLPVNDPPTFVQTPQPFVDMSTEDPVPLRGPGSTITISFPAAIDIDDDKLTYTWEVSPNTAFDPVFHTETADSTAITFETAQLATALALTPGANVELYHRIRADDGQGGQVTSMPQPVTFLMVSSVAIDGSDETPRSLTLRSVYPNPSSGSAIIQFGLPKPAAVRVELFDVLGRKLQTLHDGHTLLGWHEVPLVLGHEFSNGTYIVRLVSGSRLLTQSLLLVR